MHTTTFLAALFASATYAYDLTSSQVDALIGSRKYSSQGGNASCVSGTVPISFTANGTDIKLAEPQSAFELADYVTQLTRANSMLLASSDGGSRNITGTWDVNLRLCYPRDGAADNGTIQLLTHGATYDSTYWDFDAAHSYVDYAASTGRATLAYDIPGSGDSAKPDPLAVVQGAYTVELLATLAAGLRSGSLGLGRFDKIVGVGHSLGSFTMNGVASAHPDAFDALVATGFTANVTLSSVFGLLNPTPAALLRPDVFGDLPYGYFSSAAPAGVQLAFYKYPHFPAALFDAQFAARQPLALGLLLSSSKLFYPASRFTGPVFLLNGRADFSACTGDCTFPYDLTARALDMFFPRRDMGKSGSVNIEDCGHVVNGHDQALEAYRAIGKFVQDAGF